MAKRIFLTPEERTKLVKKVDDDIALDYYLQGLNDVEMSKKFGVSKSAVLRWRRKNGLVSRQPRVGGIPNLTSEELLEAHKRSRKIETRVKKTSKRCVEWKRQYERDSRAYKRKLKQEEELSWWKHIRLFIRNLF